MRHGCLAQRDCSLNTDSSQESKGAAKVMEADTYCHAIQLRIWHSDQRRASVFSENAYKALPVCVGEDGEDAHDMERMMGNPASHSNFGLASKMSKPAKSSVPEYINDQAFEK